MTKGRRMRRLLSLPEAELGDQAGIALRVLLAKVIEKRAALVDQHEKSAARVIVLRVRLEMLGQVLDAFGEDRDLHLGRAGIGLAAGMLLDQRFLALGGNRHRVTPVLVKG